tara:strand:+ start:108 stop:713 length:606 start_codon:yes stop_codon:yes gene_type:complete
MTAKIKLNAASGGGSFSLQAPSSSANNRVFTLPDIADATMATVNGITEVDQWYLTSNWTTSGATITSWSRFTTANVGAASPLGTGMSHSSGTFTFPNTGKWLILVSGVFSVEPNDTVLIQTKVTVDNSNYYIYATGKDGNTTGGTTKGGGCVSFAFVDVTNTSNVKAQIFAQSIASGTSIDGFTSDDQVQTSVIFIRMGDT